MENVIKWEGESMTNNTRDEVFEDILANEHTTELIGRAISIMEQIIDDYGDFLNINDEQNLAASHKQLLNKAIKIRESLQEMLTC